MIRNASLFLATRYLKPKRSFVTIITFLSVLGPILGVAVLIVVLSVMAGFNRDIREKILGMQAHIQLRNRFQATIVDPQPILDKLKEMGSQASPIVEGPVLIQSKKKVLAKYVKGILPHLEMHVTDIHENIIRGKYHIEDDEVLIGNELANQHRLEIGDKLLIHSPDKLTSMVTFNEDGSIDREKSGEVYVPEEMTIAGIFSLGMYEYDSSILLIHLDRADELFGLDWGSANSIQVCVDDPFYLSPILEQLSNDPLFKNLVPITWEQSNQRLFGALRVEKNLMFFLLTFIMIVAAFGISATLITVVIQKTREIGVLKALGATPYAILGIFVLQGAIVGVIGIALGTTLGLLIVHYRNGIANLLAKVMGTEIFPKDLYHLSQIPALVHPADVMTIVASALTICILAALVPAIFAATLSPTNALKNEI